MSDTVPEPLESRVELTPDGLVLRPPVRSPVMKWLLVVGGGLAILGGETLLALGFAVAAVANGTASSLATALLAMLVISLPLMLLSATWLASFLVPPPATRIRAGEWKRGNPRSVYVSETEDETLVGVRSDTGSYEVFRRERGEAGGDEPELWLAGRIAGLLGVEVVDLRPRDDLFHSRITTSRFGYERLHAEPGAPMSDVAFDHHGFKTHIGVLFAFDGGGVVEPVEIPLATIRTVEPRFHVVDDHIEGQLGLRTDTGACWIGSLNLDDTGHERGAAHLNWLAEQIRVAVASRPRQEGGAQDVPAQLRALREAGRD